MATPPEAPRLLARPDAGSRAAAEGARVTLATTGVVRQREAAPVLPRPSPRPRARMAAAARQPERPGRACRARCCAATQESALVDDAADEPERASCGALASAPSRCVFSSLRAGGRLAAAAAAARGAGRRRCAAARASREGGGADGAISDRRERRPPRAPR